MNRYGRSPRFCHLDFDKEAISDSYRGENARYRRKVSNLSYFRKQSFCGPCGPCLLNLTETTYVSQYVKTSLSDLSRERKKETIKGCGAMS